HNLYCDGTAREPYTLSLHDALPISSLPATPVFQEPHRPPGAERHKQARATDWSSLPSRFERWCRCRHREKKCAASRSRRLTNRPDRKSTRLNSSHLGISYAVFCLKK